MPFGCWVTFVRDDDAVPKVLVLLNSLRVCHTSKKIVLILGNSISPDNITRMGHYADGFIQLNSPPELASLPSVAARLHCWSIPGFSKIIFLDTDCIVLQNVDNLFTYTKTGKIGISKDTFDEKEISVLVLEPSFEFYQQIIADLKSSMKTDDAHQWLRRYLTKLPYCEELHEKYSIRVNPKASIGATSLPSIAIIHEVDVGNGYDSNDDYGSISKVAGHEPIAIIGVSCRFPEANSIDEYWELLIK
ncbi:Glycogenin-1, partial [Folsomia candida]